MINNKDRDNDRDKVKTISLTTVSFRFFVNPKHACTVFT